MSFSFLLLSEPNSIDPTSESTATSLTLQWNKPRGRVERFDYLCLAAHSEPCNPPEGNITQLVYPITLTFNQLKPFTNYTLLLTSVSGTKTTTYRNTLPTKQDGKTM